MSGKTRGLPLRTRLLRAVLTLWIAVVVTTALLNSWDELSALTENARAFLETFMSARYHSE